MARRNGKRSRAQISNHTATISSNPSIQDLEENMLIEILSRVPTAASAIRLKLVCKHWCSLISTPYFIKTFIDIHNRYHDSDKYRDDDSAKYQKPFGFLVTHLHPPFRAHDPKCAVSMFSRNSSFDFQEFSLSTSLPEKKHDIYVLASCNDLILCVSGMSRTNGSYFLCNPFTKQWVALPSPSPVSEERYPISKFGLVCENVINSLHPRYRIVRFSRGYDSGFAGNLIGVETYYSETGQWVESDSLGEVTQHRMVSNIVAYNGKLCWIDAGRKFLVTYDPFNMGHRRRISLVGDANLYQPNDKEVYSWVIGVSEGVLRIITLGNLNKLRPYSNQYYSVSVWDLVGGECSDEWRLRLKQEGRDIDILCDEGAMHPRNNDVVYFHSRLDDTYTEYNMESREFKPLNSRKLCSAGHILFPVELPWWPTPILDRSSKDQNRSPGTVNLNLSRIN